MIKTTTIKKTKTKTRQRQRQRLKTDRMKKMGYKHWDKGVPPNHPFWKIEQTIRVPLNGF